MSSISGKIIGDTFHMKNKDVNITGRITNDDIMIGLVKLNENLSSTPPQQSQSSSTGIELTGIDIRAFSDMPINELIINDCGSYVSYLAGIIDEENYKTYLIYPFETVN